MLTWDVHFGSEITVRGIGISIYFSSGRRLTEKIDCFGLIILMLRYLQLVHSALLCDQTPNILPNCNDMQLCATLAKSRNVRDQHLKSTKLAGTRHFTMWALMSRITNFRRDEKVRPVFNWTTTLGHRSDRLHFERVANATRLVWVFKSNLFSWRMWLNPSMDVFCI